MPRNFDVFNKLIFPQLKDNKNSLKAKNQNTKIENADCQKKSSYFNKLIYAKTQHKQIYVYKLLMVKPTTLNINIHQNHSCYTNTYIAKYKLLVCPKVGSLTSKYKS